MFFKTHIELGFNGKYWVAQTSINIRPGEYGQGDMREYVFENGGHQTFCGNGTTPGTAVASMPSIKLLRERNC